MVARGCLRLILSHYLADEVTAIQFDYNAYGKPQLAAPYAESGLTFNLAHSGEYALYTMTFQTPSRSRCAD